MTLFTDFVTGEDPDQAYIDAARPICEERIMYGARRLAETIKDIFETRALNRMRDMYKARAATLLQ
jgi:hypothetical protein